MKLWKKNNKKLNIDISGDLKEKSLEKEKSLLKEKSDHDLRSSND